MDIISLGRSTVNAFIVGVICTIIGVVLTSLLQKLEEFLRNQKRSDLAGEWFSVSHGGDESRVEDRVEISMRSGRLYLINKDKPSTYSYDVTCYIKDKNILVGDWKSLLPGSSVSGHVVLLISSHGDYMYGIYSGADKVGKPMLLGWALGRTKDALSRAEASLKTNLEIPAQPSLPQTTQP